MSVTSTLILSPPPEGGKVAVNGSHKPPVENKKAAIQRLSQGVTLSGTPSFTSLELKRHWMLEHLAGAFRVFARKGFVEGLTGHISLRDPGKDLGSQGHAPANELQNSETAFG